MSLGTEESKYIAKMWIKYDRSTPKVRSSFKKKFGFHISFPTILRVVRKKKLNLNPHGGLRYGIGEEEFRMLYNENNWIIEDIAKKVKGRCAIPNLRWKCRSFNLPYYHHGSIHIFDENSGERREYTIERERFEVLQEKCRKDLGKMIRRLEKENVRDI